MRKHINKSKNTHTKPFIRLIHLQALLFLIVYNFLSKYVFIKSLISESLFINFFGPYLFGIIAGFVLMYLLSHEDFFHFMKEVEVMEKNAEKKMIHRYLHHGKLLAIFLIMAISGPVLGVMCSRLLLPKYRWWFLLLIFGNLVSTALTVGLAKGLFVNLIR